MSSTPNELAPAGKLPTGAVVFQPSLSLYIRLAAPPSLPTAFTSFALGAAFPHGYMRPSSPRAAYSHSASVGSRLPIHLQYAAAWYQSTQLRGWPGRSSRLQSGSFV